MSARNKTRATKAPGDGNEPRRSNGAPDSPTRDDSPYADEQSILAAVGASKRLTTFARLARLAGIEELFTGSGWSTVFAPSDRAFAELSRDDLDALVADRGALIEMVKRHIVPTRVTAPRPGVPLRITALGGRELVLSAHDGGYLLGNARVVRTNIRASNGVVHVIDAVLAPA